MKLEIHSKDGLRNHCNVAAVIIREIGINTHTRFHIRSAIREATLKVTPNPGTAKHSRAKLMSIDAKLKETESGMSGLVLEHAVPVSVICSKVLDLGTPSWEEIASVVREWTLLTIITQEEHDLLKAKGLHSKMPREWNRTDKLARYSACGISVVDNEAYMRK